MKRFLIGYAICVLCLSAQEQRPRSFEATSGFGNILYPGTGRAPAQRQNTNPTVQRQTAMRGIAPAASARPRILILPYYFPMPYYGFDPNYSEPLTSDPPQYQQQQAPVVVINQNFAPEVARPVVREYASNASGGIRISIECGRA